MIKNEIDQYSYLDKQKAKEREDLDKTIITLWRILQDIEQIFPEKDFETSNRAYSLEDHGLTD